MSQDLVADALNMMMNAKKAKKRVITLKKHSKLLSLVLAIAKLNGYVESYVVQDDGTMKIKLGKINNCGAIKPRFTVKVATIEKYTERYLPAKNMGLLIVSTSQGLMTHKTAIEKNLGGSLIAYIY